MFDLFDSEPPTFARPTEANARIIFYYGKRSIPPPYSLIGAELDDHFGFAITARIEAANQFYRDRVHQLLEGLK